MAAHAQDQTDDTSSVSGAYGVIGGTTYESNPGDFLCQNPEPMMNGA